MSAAEKLPEVPALSPSIAHVLTSESALHAWTIHRLLGNRPKKVTDDQERGRLLHALVLEAGAGIEIIDADDFRTKDAQRERDGARAAGKIPVCGPKHVEALVTAGKIRERIDEIRIRGERIDLSAGIAEQRMEWSEFAVHGDITCHGHIDWLRNDHQLVLDLKTGDGSGHPDMCAAKLLRSAGVIQDAAYRRAVESLDKRVAGRVEFVFLFAQTVEPFAVTPIECAGSMREIGVNRWERAIELWSRCLATNHWPSYATAPVRVEAPAWAVARELMEDAA